MSVIDRTSSEFKDYLELYQRASLLESGQLADAERWRHHPERVVTYIIDRNINYTNVCNATASSAHSIDGQGREDYVLTLSNWSRSRRAEGDRRRSDSPPGRASSVLPFEWYLYLMPGTSSGIHTINIHGFSPPE